MANHLMKVACLAALASLIVTGCGAPRPPMPSGQRIAINGQPVEHQEIDLSGNANEQYPNIENTNTFRQEGRR